MSDENLKTTDPRNVPEDGGPAFPTTIYYDGTESHGRLKKHGLSLRDYFAAHAPEMPIAWPQYAYENRLTDLRPGSSNFLCPGGHEFAWRYYYATMMLEARKS